MNRQDHLTLLRDGVRAGGRWADLGCGTGAFALALAALAGPRADIFGVDRDARSLRVLEREMAREFPEILLVTICADFTTEISFQPLDGVILANSLHFQSDSSAVLRHVARWLKPGGTVVVVEYDVAEPGPWVPHPLPRSGWKIAAACAGLTGPRILAERPSRFHGRVYSALAFTPNGS